MAAAGIISPSPAIMHTQLAAPVITGDDNVYAADEISLSSSSASSTSGFSTSPSMEIPSPPSYSDSKSPLIATPQSSPFGDSSTTNAEQHVQNSSSQSPVWRIEFHGVTNLVRWKTPTTGVYMSLDDPAPPGVSSALFEPAAPPPSEALARFLEKSVQPEQPDTLKEPKKPISRTTCVVGVEGSLFELQEVIDVDDAARPPDTGPYLEAALASSPSPLPTKSAYPHSHPSSPRNLPQSAPVASVGLSTSTAQLDLSAPNPGLPQESVLVHQASSSPVPDESPRPIRPVFLGQAANVWKPYQNTPIKVPHPAADSSIPLDDSASQIRPDTFVTRSMSEPHQPSNRPSTWGHSNASSLSGALIGSPDDLASSAPRLTPGADGAENASRNTEGLRRKLTKRRPGSLPITSTIPATPPLSLRAILSVGTSASTSSNTVSEPSASSSPTSARTPASGSIPGSTLSSASTTPSSCHNKLRKRALSIAIPAETSYPPSRLSSTSTLLHPLPESEPDPYIQSESSRPSDKVQPLTAPPTTNRMRIFQLGEEGDSFEPAPYRPLQNNDVGMVVQRLASSPTTMDPPRLPDQMPLLTPSRPTQMQPHQPASCLQNASQEHLVRSSRRKRLSQRWNSAVVDIADDAEFLNELDRQLRAGGGEVMGIEDLLAAPRTLSSSGADSVPSARPSPVRPSDVRGLEPRGRSRTLSTILSPGSRIVGVNGDEYDEEDDYDPYVEVTKEAEVELLETMKKAMMCVREIVRTERSYLAHLISASEHAMNTPTPSPFFAHLPALTAASAAFAASIEADTSIWGVSAAFVRSSNQLESALVAWCTVVGEVIVSAASASFSGTGAPYESTTLSRSSSLRASIPSTSSFYYAFSSSSSRRGRDLLPGGSPLAVEGREINCVALAAHASTASNRSNPVNPPRRNSLTLNLWRRSTTIMQGPDESGKAGATSARPRVRARTMSAVNASAIPGQAKMNTGSFSSTGSSARRLSLQDITIMPTQRVARYVMLYRDLLKLTPATSRSHYVVQEALNTALRIAKRCDEAQNHLDLLF